MYKIAFFLDLRTLGEHVFAANLDLGNPGTGGTHYLFLLTVKHLNKVYGQQYALLLNNSRNSFSDTNICTDYTENELAAIKYCEEQGINTLVFNANVAEKLDFVNIATNVKIALWAHNTLNIKRQRIAAHAHCISKVICVSESQYKNMQDTACFAKCCYINNVYSDDFYQNAPQTDYSEKKVAYVGSLMPQKGVHNLLDIWRFVEKESPDIQLYIFGGGNVWNAKTKVSSKTGADFFYNKIVEKKLNKLKHPENIHFMGSMGWNKISREINTFRLGVVNPSHFMRDETFCLSAVEMEAHGIPIVSRFRHDGLSSTINHGKTGFLEKEDHNIAKHIVDIVNNKDKAKQLGKNARTFAENFVVAKEISKWCDLVEDKIEVPNQLKNAIISNDGKLLIHDKLLYVHFLFSSSKIFHLIGKKLHLIH